MAKTNPFHTEQVLDASTVEQLMNTRRQLRQIIAAAARSLEHIEEMLKLPEEKRYRPSAN